jgi:hypothetical protein
MDDHEASATTTTLQAPTASASGNPSLEAALDDLDGLFEASRALADEGRRSKLVRNKVAVKALRHELAAAADGYATTMIATLHGDLDWKRIRKCRKVALAAMPTAAARQKDLASLVSEKRLPSANIRDDLRQLITLSLHCRAALDALGPTVDKRAAEAIGNKVLVELREITLMYLASVRQAGDGGTEKPRSAVVSYLEKAEAHAKGFEALAPESGGGSAHTLGVSLSKDVVDVLHQTHLSWAPNSDHSAG